MKLPSPNEITTDWLANTRDEIDDVLSRFDRLWDDVSDGEASPEEAVLRVKSILDPLQIDQ